MKHNRSLLFIVKLIIQYLLSALIINEPLLVWQAMQSNISMNQLQVGMEKRAVNKKKE